jgi:hypothetical protein
MAAATASQAAINITMVIPRLMASSGSSLRLLVIDSLLTGLLPEVDRWSKYPDRFVLSGCVEIALGYTTPLQGSIIPAQAGSRDPSPSVE